MPKLKPKTEPNRCSFEEAATRRLLSALQDLDRLDKFRLAAIVMWIRGEWRGESTVLADTEGAIKLIAAMTEREARQAIEYAAESNLCAAVTS